MRVTLCNDLASGGLIKHDVLFSLQTWMQCSMMIKASFLFDVFLLLGLTFEPKSYMNSVSSCHFIGYISITDISNLYG